MWKTSLFNLNGFLNKSNVAAGVKLRMKLLTRSFLSYLIESDQKTDFSSRSVALQTEQTVAVTFGKSNVAAGVKLCVKILMRSFLSCLIESDQKTDFSSQSIALHRTNCKFWVIQLSDFHLLVELKSELFVICQLDPIMYCWISFPFAS